MRWIAFLAVTVACAPGGRFEPEAELAPEVEAAGTREEGSIRVVTWNIETVGEPGSTEYDAALEILDRIRPDVLALNEIAGASDTDNAEWLAVDAGFPHVVVAGGTGYGGDRNAILSRFPLGDAGGRTAADLSGDASAFDITREFVVATVHSPRGELDVVSMHWKSNWDDIDEFRRVLESHRAVQAVRPGVPAVLTGDWNDDIRDPDDYPRVFRRIPGSLPSDFWIGSDLWSALQGDGLANTAFGAVLDAGFVIPDTRQRSGTDATRPVSGRRLDYIAVSPEIEIDGHEVFDCRDQHRPGLEMYGAAVPDASCPAAADHLPVVMDLTLPDALDGGAEPPEPGEVVPVASLEVGDLVISEVLANPDVCTDAAGEWFEIHNLSATAVQLAGLEVRDASGNRGTLEPAVLPAGAYAVLGRASDEPCGPAALARYAADVSLNNGGDALILSIEGRTLDTLDWSASTPDTSWTREGCTVAPTPGEANPGCP